MFKINRKALAAELALLQTTAERKGSIPILAFVKVECEGATTRLTATDLDVSIVSTVESSGDPWSGCVLLAQLNSLVKLFDGDDVLFTERANERLEIASGQSKHLLPTEPVDRFPQVEIAKGDGFKVSGETLAGMIKATAFWIRPYSDDLKQNEHKQTGLSIRSDGKSVEVMAQNRTSAAIATLTLDSPEFNTIIPKQAVAALRNFNDELEIVTGDNHTVFITPQRTLIARRMEGQFPIWRTLLPKYEHEVQVPGEFADTVKRVSVTTDRGRVYFEVLKLTIAKDSLRLESRGGDHGQSEEILKTSSTLNGQSMEIGVNGNQILEALNAAGGDVICKFDAPDKPLLFEPPAKGFDVCYLTMPCRLEF